MEHLLTCSICGHRFDPAAHAACSACPLNKDCKMVCCPACGTSQINPAQSTLVRWVTRLFGERNHELSSR